MTSDRPMSDLQRELRESQIHVLNRAPLCCCEGVESEEVVERREGKIWKWLRAIALRGRTFIKRSA